MNRKRLYRCRYDRQLAGVAGGIAEYLDIDPTVVRLLWIVSVIFGGFTILLYILMAFIVPLEPVGYGLAPAGLAGGEPAMDATGPDAPADQVSGADPHASLWAQHGGAMSEPHQHARGGSGASLLTISGVLFLVFGAIALVGPSVPGWVGGLHLGPAFLLALGIALLVASIRRTAPDR